MNLYIICRKECNHYLASSNWTRDNGFKWTADIFFAVFSSDKHVLDLYYSLELLKYPAYLSDFHIREMTEQENAELLYHQCHHYHWEFNFTPTK